MTYPNQIHPSNPLRGIVDPLYGPTNADGYHNEVPVQQIPQMP